MKATSQASLDATAQQWEAVLGMPGVQPFALAQEMFAVVDTLDANHSLRRALSEPTREGEAKAALAGQVFAPKFRPEVVEAVASLSRGRWSTDRDLAEATDVLGSLGLLASAARDVRLAQLEEDLFRMTRVLAEQRPLRVALADFSVPREQRLRLLREVFASRVAPEALVVAERAVGSTRVSSVTEALVAAGELVAQRRHQLVAIVTAAVPLTSSQQSRLASTLERAYGRVVKINSAIDPAVIGGIRVQVGDEVVDATVLTRLADARRRLSGISA